MKRAQNKTGIHIRRVILFYIYLGALAYFLFFAEGFGRGGSNEYHYNFIPFREISRYLTYVDVIGVSRVVLNLLGNIVAFIPFGFFLPMLSDNRLRSMTMLLFSLEFSVLIEVIQLITRLGSCDVDDVILNTLGGFLGCLIYKIYVRVFDKV